MINLGFWGEIKKPIFCLAPMADVTDRMFFGQNLYQQMDCVVLAEKNF